MIQLQQGRLPLADTYAGKRVLVTGHTGFKGAWLSTWLHAMGAHVYGIGLPPTTIPSLFDLTSVDAWAQSFMVDLTNHEQVLAHVTPLDFDFVFHLAAQALVRASYDDPVRTFDTNVMGTVHLLDALRRRNRPCVVVVITSDKVYHNEEWPYPYRESDRLGGHDPYSASKAATEIVTDSFRDAFLRSSGIVVATARAGNVIGGGDWAADRLLPDAVRAWASGQPLQIRRPGARRPWQHVLDALNGYLVLAESMVADPSLAQAWNFGPTTQHTATVREVIDLARSAYATGETIWASSEHGPHETDHLTVESAKARSKLGVSGRWGLMQSIERTMTWYRRHSAGEHARDLCMSDLAAYRSEG